MKNEIFLNPQKLFFLSWSQLTAKISFCVLFFFFPQSSSQQNINEVCWNGNFSLCIIRVNETCLHSQCASFISVKFNFSKNGGRKKMGWRSTAMRRVWKFQGQLKNNNWDQKSSSAIGANTSSQPDLCASVLPVKRATLALHQSVPEMGTVKYRILVSLALGSGDQSG